MTEAAANPAISGQFVLDWWSRWVKIYLRNPFVRPIDFRQRRHDESSRRSEVLGDDHGGGREPVLSPAW
jgi:hypothetical protein